ncbi:unnamed protein product [Caenorhabditis brenneri]
MTFLMDFHITFLMQPVPLYPLLAGFTVGILADWFDISTHYSMMMVMFIASTQLEVLVACFSKKHQAIAITLNFHIMPKPLEYFCYFLCVICPFIACGWFHSTHLSEKDQWDFIQQSFPEHLHGFKTIKHFDIYIQSLSITLCMICVIVGGLVLFLLFLIFITDTFRMMNQLKPRVSRSNYERHVEAIKSLVVQLFTASVAFGVPCLIVVVIFLGIDQAQLITELCVAWMAGKQLQRKRTATGISSSQATIYPLANFQMRGRTTSVLGTITDIHLTHLMQPVPLYPLFAGYTVGILAEWFDVSTHVSMMMVMFIATFQLESLTLCFAKKHQAIAITLKYHIVPKWFEYFCYFCCIVCPIAVCIWFHTTHLSKEEQWKYIKESLPDYLEGFQSIQHFDIYIQTPSMMLLNFGVILAGVGLGTLFLIFMADIFRIMILLKPRIAKSNYEKHLEAIKSLVVQLVTASMAFGLPCVLAVVIFSGIQQAQVVTELCIAWIAAYSSINTVSLMIFFPPFRTFILQKLGLKQPERRNFAAVSSIML